MNNELILILCTVCGVYLAWKLFDRVLFPQMVYHGMKETERNPKWVTSPLAQYYGLSDIDFVLCNSKFGMLPRFRLGKKGQLELWIDKETSTKDVEELGRIALIAKIKAKYNLWFPDKPVYWLSILCFMLDGGDISVMDKTKTENK